MPFVVTDDDCEIYYEADGNGPAVAFISGFMGITDIWSAQIDALKAHYRCIAFDTRGAHREIPAPGIPAAGCFPIRSRAMRSSLKPSPDSGRPWPASRSALLCP